MGTLSLAQPRAHEQVLAQGFLWAGLAHHFGRRGGAVVGAADRPPGQCGHAEPGQMTTLLREVIFAFWPSNACSSLVCLWGIVKCFNQFFPSVGKITAAYVICLLPNVNLGAQLSWRYYFFEVKGPKILQPDALPASTIDYRFCRQCKYRFTPQA